MVEPSQLCPTCGFGGLHYHVDEFTVVGYTPDVEPPPGFAGSTLRSARYDAIDTISASVASVDLGGGVRWSFAKRGVRVPLDGPWTASHATEPDPLDDLLAAAGVHKPNPDAASRIAALADHADALNRIRGQAALVRDYSIRTNLRIYQPEED